MNPKKEKKLPAKIENSPVYNIIDDISLGIFVQNPDGHWNDETLDLAAKKILESVSDPITAKTLMTIIKMGEFSSIKVFYQDKNLHGPNFLSIEHVLSSLGSNPTLNRIVLAPGSHYAAVIMGTYFLNKNPVTVYLWNLD